MGGPRATTGLRHELPRRKPVGAYSEEHAAGAGLQRTIGTLPAAAGRRLTAPPRATFPVIEPRERRARKVPGQPVRSMT